MLGDLFISLRPKQWSKNVIVFAGLFFAEDIFDMEKIIPAVMAFLVFCIVSSSGYLINDVLDQEKDRLHPRKKFRPIAAGKISVPLAYTTAFLFIGVGLYLGYNLSYAFGIIISTYFLLTLFYSVYLKRVIIIDVLIISSGFMFRAVGGTLAIGEVVSSWLIICTIFLALFLALIKRRAEFVALKDNASRVRKTLAQYNVQFLDQMINIVSAACLMAYALYTLDPETVNKFGTRNLVFTLPFVIYGLFRYLALVHNYNQGESPELVILKDKPLLVCVGLYGLAVFLIIYL